MRCLRVFPAVLLLLLAGCATEPLRWQRAETSRETIAEDLADCRMQTPPALVNVATPPGTHGGQRYEAVAAREMWEVEHCMRLKGYSPSRR